MPSWIFRRDIRDTTPAPRTAPAGAAMDMEARVRGLTMTTDMKMKAWVAVGIVLPTFIVPGMTRSSTSLKNLKMAVCWAKLPMPRVSSMLVMKPVPKSSGPGDRGEFLSALVGVGQVVEAEERGQEAKCGFQDDDHGRPW